MIKFGRPTEEDYQLVAEVVEDMAKDIWQPLSAPVQPVSRKKEVKYIRG